MKKLLLGLLLCPFLGFSAVVVAPSGGTATGVIVTNQFDASAIVSGVISNVNLGLALQQYRASGGTSWVGTVAAQRIANLNGLGTNTYLTNAVLQYPIITNVILSGVSSNVGPYHSIGDSTFWGSLIASDIAYLGTNGVYPLSFEICSTWPNVVAHSDTNFLWLSVGSLWSGSSTSSIINWHQISTTNLTVMTTLGLAGSNITSWAQIGGGTQQVTTVQLNAASNAVLAITQPTNNTLTLWAALDMTGQSDGSFPYWDGAAWTAAVDPTAGSVPHFIGGEWLFVFPVKGLTNLSDVVTNGLVNGDVLTWNATALKWTNSPVTASATNAIANLNGFGTNTWIVEPNQSYAMTPNSGGYFDFVDLADTNAPVRIAPSATGGSISAFGATFGGVEITNTATIGTATITNLTVISNSSFSTLSIGTLTVTNLINATNIGGTVTNATYSALATNVPAYFTNSHLTVNSNVAWRIYTYTLATNDDAGTNFVMSFDQGVQELFLTNNVLITNCVGADAGFGKTVTAFIEPQLIVRTVNYPVWWKTNSTAPLWTSFTNGNTYMLTLQTRGTNVYALTTLWP